MNGPSSYASDSSLVSSMVMINAEEEALELVIDFEEETLEPVMDFEQETLKLVMNFQEEVLKPPSFACRFTPGLRVPMMPPLVLQVHYQYHP